MSRRARFGAYGSAALAILAGVVCAVVLGGTLGAVLALALGNGVASIGAPLARRCSARTRGRVADGWGGCAASAASCAEC